MSSTTAAAAALLLMVVSCGPAAAAVLASLPAVLKLLLYRSPSVSESLPLLLLLVLLAVCESAAPALRTWLALLALLMGADAAGAGSGKPKGCVQPVVVGHGAWAVCTTNCCCRDVRSSVCFRSAPACEGKRTCLHGGWHRKHRVSGQQHRTCLLISSGCQDGCRDLVQLYHLIIVRLR